MKGFYELAKVNKHILVTGYLKEAPGAEYVPYLENWFRRLVKAVDMEVLIEPICVWCGDEGNEGVTGMVGITTSHSSIHFWSGELGEPSYYKFDLYSCKEFALESVADMLKELDTYKFTYTIVDRTDDEHPVIDSGVITF
jgi:S-adenosylmethionine/arginine decarboxylase-like enzyme